MPDATSVLTEVFPTIEERVLDLSQKLEHLIVTKSPAAWDTLLTVVKVEAAQELVFGTLIIAASAGLFIGGRKALLFDRKEQQESHSDAADGSVFMLAVILFTLAFLVSLFSLQWVFNIWNYVAFISPEIVVAHKVLQGLL